MQKEIVVHGACEHNLKNVDVSIPRDKLTVITGVSGSGKSSLAFDTIYVEGQRRFMESLSSYARQFLTQAHKPKVESIDGLGPTIAIEQRKGSMNPRSTVATVTEIYDFLRLLYARIGVPKCPHCKKIIARQTSTEVVNQLIAEKQDRFSILAPLVRGRKGEHKELINMALKEGFPRIKINNEIHLCDDPLPVLDPKKKHSISIVVDRFVAKGLERSRLAASVEIALKLGKHALIVDANDSERYISTSFACSDCNFSFGEIEPRNFSFNSPFGACSACHGLGTDMEIDRGLLMPNEDLSIDDGVLAQAMKLSHFMWLKFPAMIDRTIKKHKIDTEIAFSKLSKTHQDLLLYGENDSKKKDSFLGIIYELENKFHQADSESTKGRIHKFMALHPCRVCKGSRLKSEMQSIFIGKKSIQQFTELTIDQALIFFDDLNLNDDKTNIAREPIKEIRSRLHFMHQVGLHYLTLNRTSGTLSGGEAQRIRLASQIGSKLVGVVYVLDEPSIGLHQRDNRKLIESLQDLKNLGNTVIVVEHDEDTIRHADYLIDVGPQAGEHGGRIVEQDTPKAVIKRGKSLTAKYLNRTLQIEVPTKRRKGNKKFIELKGASLNNLKNVNIKCPLGQFIAITGVSGSGKSSLINRTLYPALQKALYNSSVRPGPYKSLKGIENIDKVIDINQSPIGKTTRSNPATYVKVFDAIRSLYASLPLSKSRGYSVGRFSFNVKGGRCEACEGQGTKIIEMHFLADVTVTCEVCHGKRFNPETLDIVFKGKTIFDILKMTVENAIQVFSDHPKIIPALSTLNDVGLSYVKLGQSSTTLSGGESQRIKLAAELSKRSTGNTLYILDEPTTGLHFDDIKKLLVVLNRLVDTGNTVIVIEHNLDVIKTADTIFDVGPEGGGQGGKIIASGSPEALVKNKNSHTAKFLKEML